MDSLKETRQIRNIVIRILDPKGTHPWFYFRLVTKWRTFFWTDHSVVINKLKLPSTGSIVNCSAISIVWVSLKFFQFPSQAFRFSGKCKRCSECDFYEQCHTECLRTCSAGHFGINYHNIVQNSTLRISFICHEQRLPILPIVETGENLEF